MFKQRKKCGSEKYLWRILIMSYLKRDFKWNSFSSIILFSGMKNNLIQSKKILLFLFQFSYLRLIYMIMDFFLFIAFGKIFLLNLWKIIYSDRIGKSNFYSCNWFCNVEDAWDKSSLKFIFFYHMKNTFKGGWISLGKSGLMYIIYNKIMKIFQNWN